MLPNFHIQKFAGTYRDTKYPAYIKQTSVSNFENTGDVMDAVYTKICAQITKCIPENSLVGRLSKYVLMLTYKMIFDVQEIILRSSRRLLICFTQLFIYDWKFFMKKPERSMFRLCMPASDMHENIWPASQHETFETLTLWEFLMGSSQVLAQLFARTGQHKQQV